MSFTVTVSLYIQTVSTTDVGDMLKLCSRKWCQDASHRRGISQ